MPHAMGEIGINAAPKWLNAVYLENILCKNKQDPGLKVINLDIKPATSKGENYASIMTRIVVEFRRSNTQSSQKESYLVKATHENDPVVANIMAPYDITRTEMIMYEKVLPKLSALLREIGDEEKIFAETIFVDYEQNAIIFEDLAIHKYKNANRLLGLDFEHAKLAFTKLAKMHATAAAYNERHPGQLTKFDRGIFNRHTSGFSPFFEGVVQIAAEFAGECAELGNYYQEKLLKLKDRVMEYSTRVFDLKNGHFHTLTHGDFWTNNMMYRYDDADDKSITDLVLVDFQFCSWTSPAVDILYFLNTSLKYELRFSHKNKLIQHYHQVLVETLHKLNFTGYIPTLRNFVLQLEDGAFYSVITTLASQAIMLNEDTNDADANALLVDTERGRNFRKSLYENKTIQNICKNTLPLLDQIGLLDVTD